MMKNSNIQAYFKLNQAKKSEFFDLTEAQEKTSVLQLTNSNEVKEENSVLQLINNKNCVEIDNDKNIKEISNKESIAIPQRTALVKSSPADIFKQIKLKDKRLQDLRNTEEDLTVKIEKTTKQSSDIIFSSGTNSEILTSTLGTSTIANTDNINSSFTVTLKCNYKKLKDILKNPKNNSNSSYLIDLTNIETAEEGKEKKLRSKGFTLSSGKFLIAPAKVNYSNRSYEVTFKIDPVKMKNVLDKQSQPIEIPDIDDENVDTSTINNNNKIEPVVEIITELDKTVKEVKRKDFKCSFFKEIADRAHSQKSTSKYLLSKSDLERCGKYPIIRRNQFHIRDIESEDLNFISNSKTNGLNKLKNRENHQIDLDDMEYNDSEQFSIFFKNYIKIPSKIDAPSQPIYYSSYVFSSNLYELLATIYNIQLDDYRLLRLLNIPEGLKYSENSQWCDILKPMNHLHVIQNYTNTQFLYDWFLQAFEKLKSVDSNKRKQKLARNSKKNISSSSAFYDNSMDDFIVDDVNGYYDESFDNDGDYDDDEGGFVPVLVITGPISSGKTSSVYATIKEELQGYIFEINSSQSRAKKDISFHLKQISTTQIVKRANKDQLSDSSTKGVILFDDVDLIDNEIDKEFWQAVIDCLSSSYIPIILTTNDTECVPQKILSESTVLKFEPIDGDFLKKYLIVSGIIMGYLFDQKIIDQVSKCNDLRQSLMQLQLIHESVPDHPSNGVFIQISQENVEQVSDEKKDNFSHNNNNNAFGQNLSVEEYYKAKFDTFDIDYFERVVSKYDHVVKSKEEEEISKDLQNDEFYKFFESDSKKLSDFIDYYSSRYVSSGSRKKKLKYESADEFIISEPGSLFIRLSKDKKFSELAPFIREMARADFSREQQGLVDAKKFDELSSEYFENLIKFL
ncbi:hypothetical protein BVG19_g2229 [[Candida] boidinii]|nr:hypothetical protein BVG19_g2229 [[Candida] boidinii]OWB52199.1 hypothetical protein B5S27_g3771 [[Candida] boidinii]